MPGFTEGQMAVRYLEQAQGVRALGSLGPEFLRRLPVGLDRRLVTAQAVVAVAERVEEICLVVQLSSGRPAPGIVPTFPHRHGGPSEGRCTPHPPGVRK